MKKKATDRARRKSIPCFIWTVFVTVNQNHKINLPFVKRDLCFSCAPAAQKPAMLLLGERALLSPCVMSDINRGGLVLKIHQCKYRRLMLQEALNLMNLFLVMSR